MAIKLDPRKTALIIQDLQNDVIMPNGAFTRDNPAPAEHARKQNVVANVKALAAAARAAGVPVIHVWYVVEPGAPGLKLNAPLFQAISATKGVVRGTHGAAPVKGLEAKKGDHVVEKSRMNAFHGTNLDNLLRGFGTENLVITGAWTNFSIEHTARTGADMGFSMVVPEDCAARFSAQLINYFLTPSTLSQEAAIAAFDDPASLRGAVESYARNRATLLDGLREMGLAGLAPPDGAFYLYADVGHLTDDSLAFCRELPALAGVAAIPLSAFQRDDPPRHLVRFAFCKTDAVLDEGIRRLARLRA